MPYGSESKKKAQTLVTGVNYYPGGSKSYTFHNTSNAHDEHSFLQWSRSGTNASSPKGGQVSKLPGTLELRVVEVPEGPRLPYKIKSKKTGKWVWARQKLRQWRYVRVPSKIKPAKGLDLPPNALNYFGRRTSYFGPSDGKGNATITGDAGGGYTRTISGDLWADFNPFSYGMIGPNPQNYMTTSMSDRFQAAESALSTKLLGRFYSKVKNQKVNFAQALAERAQTARLLEQMVGRLITAIKAAKTGNLPRAARALFPGNSRQLAQDWLALQYGIKPLISDISGAAALLTEPRTFQYDVKVRTREELPRERIYTQNMGTFPCKTDVYSEGYVEVTYKARVVVTDDFVRTVHRSGLLDMETLAWELTPYSFVIDWLLPIGDYLAARDAFSGLTIQYLTKTVFKKETISCTRQIGGYKNGYTWSNWTGGYVIEKVSTVRSLLSSVPKLPYPSFKDPVSAGHVANALALLRVSLKR